MIFSDQELLALNKRGFIPGPKEDERSFQERVSTSLLFAKNPKSFFEKQGEAPPFDMKEPVAYHDWEWPLVNIRHIYDVSPDWLVGYYQNQGLNFTQGAQTWIFENPQKSRLSLLQFRSGLKKGAYLKIYTRDEILSHEAIHAARIAFDEPRTEELLAYGTSKSFFRKFLGPIIQKPQEVFLFSLFLFSSLFFQVLYLFFESQIFDWLFSLSLFVTGAYLGAGFFRLARVNRSFNRAYQKLNKLLKSRKSARAVLFRLTDSEIRRFSCMKLTEIQDYSLKQSKKNLRWRVLWLAYFQVDLTK